MILSGTILLLCLNHHITLLSSPHWEPSGWLAYLQRSIFQCEWREKLCSSVQDYTTSHQIPDNCRGEQQKTCWNLFGQSEPYKRAAKRPNPLSKLALFRERYTVNQGISSMISYSKRVVVHVQNIGLLYVRVVSKCTNVKCFCPSLSLSRPPCLF